MKDRNQSRKRYFKRFVSGDRAGSAPLLRSLLRFHRNEKGGMIFSLMIAVIGIGVMVGFATNLASETIERERLQHAADSLAYASGVWFARAMNTTCSINHVLGERTAYAVVIDALCGPETTFDPCWQERDMDKRLKAEKPYKWAWDLYNLEDYAPRPGSNEGGKVGETIKNFTDKYHPDETYRPGAGLYDAKMNLKYWATDCLNNKAIATVMAGAVEKLPNGHPSGGLGELSMCKILGQSIHFTESFIMGYYGLGNITGKLDSIYSEYGSDIYGALDKTSSGLGSIGEALNNGATNVKQLGDNVSEYGAEVSQIAEQFRPMVDEVSGLASELTSVVSALQGCGLDNLEIDCLLNVSDVNGLISGARSSADSFGSDLRELREILSDEGKKLAADAKPVIESTDSDKLAEFINYGNDETNKAKAKLGVANSDRGQITSKLREVVSRLGNCLQPTKDYSHDADGRRYKDGEVFLSARIKINGLSEGRDTRLNRLRSAINSASGKINDVIGKIDELGSAISGVGAKISELGGHLQDAANKVNEAKSQIDRVKERFENPGQQIKAQLEQALGISTITSERDSLIDLEAKLAGKKSCVGSHEARSEIYSGIEKIAYQRYATIVGAPDPGKKRLLATKIDAVAEDLKKAYAVETSPNGEGFVEYAVAPMDSLVPDASEFKGGKQSSAGGLFGGSSTYKDKVVARPLLPVLGEPETEKKTGGPDYMRNVEDQAWTNENRKSPCNQLPGVPWSGTDEDGFVRNANRVIETLIIVAEVAYVAAIVYYCCEWRFASAAKAGTILSSMVALQIRGIKSSWKPETRCHPNNPSVWSYPCKAFDEEREKRSQWVRATYPVVDSLRSKLRKKYKDQVPISNLSTYFTSWCYRYALAESYFLHTGDERPYQEKYNGVDANKKIKKVCMYVIAGTNAEKKGQESFWERPEILDQMFSVCAVVRSAPHKAPAGTKAFKREVDGTMAAAQATFYPTNGRNLDKNGKLANFKTAGTEAKNLRQFSSNYYETCQPYTCWDTLQWKNYNPGGEPVLAAPEYWNGYPAMGSKKDALAYENLVDGPVSAMESSRVELCWEAMLSPVTASRLERVSNDPNADKAIRRAALNASKHAKLLAN